MRIQPFLLLAAVLGLAACSSTASLDYAPTTVVAPGPPAAVAGVSASDARGEKPNRLATVRGGYGNPLYVRDTARPVADEVAAVFAAALRQRGMLAATGDAPYRIQVVLRQLEGNHYFTRNAYIDMDLVVADRAGRTVYKDTVKDQRSETALFSASADELQRLVQTLLNATVDRMLDNPRLRAVLGGASAASGLGAPASPVRQAA